MRVVVRADFSSDCFCAHLAVKVGKLGCLKPCRGACSRSRVKALARVTRRARYPLTTRARLMRCVQVFLCPSLWLLCHSSARSHYSVDLFHTETNWPSGAACAL